MFPTKLKTTNNDSLTSDAAGNLYKTSGGRVDQSDVISKKPSSSDSSINNPSSSSDSSSSNSSSSDPSCFSGSGDSGGDSDGGGGLINSILDFLSN
ncbi:hypothetical protein GJ744_002791 [Endocarpon pusillum]|uniref:Uncharacterized protein n=1 Tax=Endocarpon pusillum TaxID=364733 RepID=A0A8H7AMW4_9EURO|nr:hypothetical protein GJ744_002791 [Endocarpon pusillum]